MPVPAGSFGKTKSHVDVCNQSGRFLHQQMSADRIRKAKVFKRNFECQITDKKNAIRSESILNQNIIRVCLYGWFETRWEIWCGFLCGIPKQLSKTSIFLPWNTQCNIPSRSLSYFRSGKGSVFGKKLTIKVLLCW